MQQPSEAFMDILAGIRQAIEHAQYNVAGRHAANFIKLAYHIQSKKDLFVGEVLEGVYTQIHRELATHTVSDKDLSALYKFMAQDFNNLLDAYTAEVGDVYGVLTNMRYNATVFQYAVIIKYDYHSPQQPQAQL